MGLVRGKGGKWEEASCVVHPVCDVHLSVWQQ